MPAIEKYYVHVTKTSSLAMEVLMAGGLEAFKKEVMPAKGEYTGPQTIRKTGLAAGTSYSVLCVGDQQERLRFLDREDTEDRKGRIKDHVRIS